MKASSLESLGELRIKSSASDATVGAACGDYNGDGLVELALPMQQFYAVEIRRLLGARDQLLGRVSVRPFFMRALRNGDFNGDGIVDLAIASSTAVAAVIYFEGGPIRAGGDPAALPSTVIPTRNDPLSLATGDVDGDGIMDLVIAHKTPSGLSLLRGERRSAWPSGRSSTRRARSSSRAT